MAYRVIAPYVTVQTRTSDGDRIVGLYEGSMLPGDVPDDQIRHHLDSGLIEEVPDPGKSDADALNVAEGEVGPQQGEPTPTGVPGMTAEAEPPARSAPKSEWQAYAVSQGATAAETDQATKEDLVNRYGR